jgi:hypothetical protein
MKQKLSKQLQTFSRSWMSKVWKKSFMCEFFCASEVLVLHMTQHAQHVK